MSRSGQPYHCDQDGIHIFHFDDDGTIDWGETLSPEKDGDEYADEAAATFTALAIQCMDPVREGWPCSGYGSIDKARNEYEEYFSHFDPDAASWYYDGNGYMLDNNADDYSDSYARDFACAFLGYDEN